MRSKLLRILSTATFAAFAGSASAVFDPVNDDTDIFLQNPAYVAARPNVLIFVDNTANWGQSADGTSKYQGVRAALTSVLNGVVNDTFNVGLAMFVETGGGNTGVTNEGAYVRYGIRQMTGTAADPMSNKGRLISIINALDEAGDRSNAARYSTAMSEIFNYFAGRQSYTGYGKTKADAGETVWTSSGRVALAGSPLPAGGDSSSTPVTYTSPIIDRCQKSFIIWISNGEAMDNSTAIANAVNQYQQQIGVAPGTIRLNPADLEGVVSDEYAKYMANSDCNTSIPGIQNVFTYAIDVIPKTDPLSKGPAHTALLKSMATNGKGKYFPITSLSSTAQIEDALKAIFQEVQSVNAVFASTTLPVSVNVRGTNLNQVYIGVFRPDANKSPRWFGNLKLYKLGVDTSTEEPTLFLADANGSPANNAESGFISGSALSYWTSNSSYWGFRDPELNGVGGESDAPDGDTVEKGGAAQRQRIRYATSNATRKLYTCLNGTGGLCMSGALLSATPFNTTNVSAADLGAYATKPVDLLTSSGTTATAKVTGHGWATGNVLRIQGATPSVYNGDYTITVLDANTFTYTLPSAVNADTARVNAPNHLLTSGDVLCVDTSPDSGYDSCSHPLYAPATKEDVNFVTYPMSASETSNASGFNVWGGRQIGSVIGVRGTNTAKVTLPNHGLGAPGTTLPASYIFGTPSVTSWYDSYSGWDATIVDANTITIPTDNPIIAAPNVALVAATGHGFSSGQTVTIFNSAIAGYNGTRTITKVNEDQFTFSSTEVLTDTGLNTRVGHRISSITHPVNNDTATVTTTTAHGFAAGQVINIYGTGAFTGNNNSTAFDRSWTVQSTPTATTFTIFESRIDRVATPVNPAAGIAGYAVSRIDPALSASGPIHFMRYLTVNSITPATSARGIVTAGRPGDADATAGNLLVEWVRSSDNRDNEDGNGISTDVRASVHGDVLHSRPVTVNYGRFPTDTSLPANDNDIYVFYGSNDGIFRAIKGSTASDESGVAPGDERWGFIPKEFFGKLRRQREQSPIISSANQKDYFFDGSIGIYQKDVTPTGGRAGTVGDDPGDKLHLYLSLRRGGDFIYALDVKDPAAPKLLWRKGKGDLGWAEIGQTWSEPKVTRLNWAFDPTNNPESVVLIFGAGYDAAVDDLNPCLLEQFNASNVVRKAIGSGIVTYLNAGSCTITGATGSPTTINRSRGRGIMVVNAFTGDVLWQVGPVPSGATYNLTHPDMTCAIPSDISVLDRNRDGRADRLYTGDTCGNVWRAEVSDVDPSNWKVTKVAALSYGANTAISTKLKFLFPPDIVFAKDGLGPHLAVLLGSGDREHPFDTIVKNSFFMLKDRDAAASSDGVVNSTTRSINVPSVSTSVVPITWSDVFDATNTEGVNQFGWKIDLAPGEKSVGAAVTISSTTFFNTNQPDATAGGGSCGSNLGVARQYLVSYVNAAATTDLNGLGTLSIANRSTVYGEGGYLPSPVPVVVEIDGRRYQAVISGTSVQSPPGLTLDSRVRTHWYRELDH